MPPRVLGIFFKLREQRTIQEFTDILLLHGAHLLNPCCGQGDHFDVVTFEQDFFFDVLAHFQGGARVARDLACDLESE